MGTEPAHFDLAFPRTHRLLLDAVRDGVFPGFSAGIWLQSEPEKFWLRSGGVKRLDPRESSPQAVDLETSFDLASLTKNLSTSLLVARLIDARILDLDTEVRSILPQAERWVGIRVRHLLSHTAGLPAWAPYYEQIRARIGGRGAGASDLATGQQVLAHPVHERMAWMREAVLSTAPEVAPDARALYSDLSFLALGFLVEARLGCGLDRAAQDWVFEPLELASFEYRPVTRSVVDATDSRYAATETCPWRGGTLQGQIHDDNTWAIGGIAGHAGVFGNVRDVLSIASKLLHSHSGFLSRQMLGLLWSRVPKPVGCERTLGWDTPSATGSSVGSAFSRNSVGHLGFTGTSFWLDLDAGIAVSLLTNRVHPTRANEEIREFRPRFHAAVREDLGF